MIKSTNTQGERSTMTANVAEQVSEAKSPPAVARVERASRKPASSETASALAARFFLAKTEPNGNAPAFDREMPTEAEALLESLKTGRTYYSVIEWRAVADCAGKAPQVKKEPVGNPRKGGGYCDGTLPRDGTRET